MHKALGPGLRERLYEKALAIELDEQHIPYRRQVKITADYKGRRLGHYVADFIIDESVIVEVKSVTIVLPVFKGQLITYMRLTKIRCGLILNFNAALMKDGIHRLVL